MCICVYYIYISQKKFNLIVSMHMSKIENLRYIFPMAPLCLRAVIWMIISLRL